MIIGREREREMLRQAYESDYSQFVAVYGRRRVGKTFLIRETFNYSFTFQHAGVAKKDTREQLKYFRASLERCGLKKVRIPRDWTDAFFLLEQLINKSDEKKKVIFIDETPWMDAPKSGFLTALEYFWNVVASARKDILLIICGSATSWIIDKVLKNHGGLHNRVNCRIALQPFSLHECELYANSQGIAASRYDLLEYYMVLGGVPFYWSKINKAMSVAQNIDSMLFAQVGELHNEFKELYDSLFHNPEPYIDVINALGTIKVGMTREALISEGHIPGGRQLTEILEDLEECGFIRKYNMFGEKKRNAIYQLIDNFTLFYFKYMKENTNGDEHFWSHSYLSPVRYAWVGLAFERVCMQHIRQIKEKLQIGGVLTNVSSWSVKSDPVYGAGAQIDLLIERADNVVNVCEIKFSNDKFAIDAAYASNIRHKLERLIRGTDTTKTLHFTMITVNGIAHNEYWNMVQSEVEADDLFKD